MTPHFTASVFLLLLLPLTAQGQAGPPTGETDVQRSFASGSAALRAGRFHEARDLLRDAHRAANAVGTAFNLGVALRGTGEVRECAALFEELLSGTFGEATADVAAQSEALRDECRSAEATLTVRVSQAATVHVDGVPIGDIEPDAPRDVPLDPGAHVITAAHQGFVTAQERVLLARAEHGSVTLALIPAVTAALSSSGPEPTDRPSDTASVLEEAWFWVLVIGVGLAVGGVALGVALTPPSVAEPVGSPWSAPRVIP